MFKAKNVKMLTIEFFSLGLWSNIVIYKERLLVKKFILKEYIDKLCIQPSRVDITLLVNNIEPTFEDFEVVEEDQVSQQVDKFNLIRFKKLMKKSKRRKLSWLRRIMKMKGILCKSCVEKNIFLKNYEEVKDEKMEIICKEIHKILL